MVTLVRFTPPHSKAVGIDMIEQSEARQYISQARHVKSIINPT
jgi:hypothetical protein